MNYPGGFEQVEIQGATILIAGRYREEAPELLSGCIRIMERTLGVLAAGAPAAWAKIKHNTIWLEYEDARFEDRAVYHESPEWVAANGYDPAKGRCVQLTKALALWNKDQPMILVHELAHQYHHQVLKYDDPSILAAYARAATSGQYQSVKRNTGEVGSAYALTNHKEYFSELSEAYFGENDWYPFTRDELMQFDPMGYEAIAKAWLRP